MQREANPLGTVHYIPLRAVFLEHLCAARERAQRIHRDEFISELARVAWALLHDAEGSVSITPYPSSPDFYYEARSLTEEFDRNGDTLIRRCRHRHARPWRGL